MKKLIIKIGTFMFALFSVIALASFSADAKIGPMPVANSGTTIKYDAVIGKTYSNYKNVIPKNNTFGSPTYYSYAPGKALPSSFTDYFIGSDDYWGESNTAETYAVVYKMDKYLNTSVQQFGDKVVVAKNRSATETRTITDGISNCHTESFSSTLSSKVGVLCDMGINIPIDGINIGLKEGFSAEQTNSVTKTVSDSTTTTHSESYSTSFNITHSGSAYEEELYLIERRANHTVYLVQLFETVYTSSLINKRMGNWFCETWYDIQYNVSGYKLVSQSLTFSLIEGSQTIGAYQYLEAGNGELYFKNAGVSGNKVLI